MPVYHLILTNAMLYYYYRINHNNIIRRIHFYHYTAEVGTQWAQFSPSAHAQRESMIIH